MKIDRFALINEILDEDQSVLNLSMSDREDVTQAALEQAIPENVATAIYGLQDCIEEQEKGVEEYQEIVSQTIFPNLDVLFYLDAQISARNRNRKLYPSTTAQAIATVFVLLGVFVASKNPMSRLQVPTFLMISTVLIAALYWLYLLFKFRRFQLMAGEVDVLIDDYLSRSLETEKAIVHSAMQQDADYADLTAATKEIQRELKELIKKALVIPAVALCRPITDASNRDSSGVEIDQNEHGGTHNMTEGNRETIPTVFVSYSRLDQVAIDWLDLLQLHCKPFERDQRFVLWHDELIETGTEWEKQIESRLVGSEATVLIVGPGFMASDFVQDSEIPELMSRARSHQGLPIFPLIVSSCAYERSELGKFQSWNIPSKPLDALSLEERNSTMARFVADLDEQIGASPQRASR